MSWRRSGAPEDQLLDDRLLSNPPKVARDPRVPATPERTPLSWLSDANRAMHAESDPPPSRMQPPEDQAGYVLVVAMVILGTVLTVVHGKGSPKHPDRWLQIIGLAIAVLTPLAIFRWANRFVTAIMVVVSALFISLVHPPQRWELLEYVLLVS